MWVWCISGKKITTFDCTIFLEQQAYVRLLKLLFFLGARTSHLEAKEMMGFYGGMPPPDPPLYPPLGESSKWRTLKSTAQSNYRL